MSQEVFEDWSAQTVISEEELQQYTFLADTDDTENIEIRSYCIEIAGDTLATGDFIQFIKEKFPFFIFPKDEINELGHMAYREAREQTGHDSDYEKSGLPGELLLFLYVEGILDMPLICHKFAIRESISGEQKGSDGIFYGEYGDVECLALGEAKFYKNRKDAIRKSLESTSRFYGPDSDSFRWNEINVAARNIERTNLTKSQIEELSEKLTTGPREYNHVHPIFIGYEKSELESCEIKAEDREQLREMVLELLNDDEITTYIEEKIEKEHSELKKHQLVFIFLPVDSSKDFKERAMRSIHNPRDQ